MSSSSSNLIGLDEIRSLNTKRTELVNKMAEDTRRQNLLSQKAQENQFALDTVQAKQAMYTKFHDDKKEIKQDLEKTLAERATTLKLLESLSQELQKISSLSDQANDSLDLNPALNGPSSTELITELKKTNTTIKALNTRLFNLEKELEQLNYDEIEARRIIGTQQALTNEIAIRKSLEDQMKIQLKELDQKIARLSQLEIDTIIAALADPQVPAVNMQISSFSPAPKPTETKESTTLTNDKRGSVPIFSSPAVPSAPPASTAPTIAPAPYDPNKRPRLAENNIVPAAPVPRRDVPFEFSVQVRQIQFDTIFDAYQSPSLKQIFTKIETDIKDKIMPSAVDLADLKRRIEDLFADKHEHEAHSFFSLILQDYASSCAYYNGKSQSNNYSNTFKLLVAHPQFFDSQCSNPPIYVNHETKCSLLEFIGNQGDSSLLSHLFNRITNTFDDYKSFKILEALANQTKSLKTHLLTSKVALSAVDTMSVKSYQHLLELACKVLGGKTHSDFQIFREGGPNCGSILPLTYAIRKALETNANPALQNKYKNIAILLKNSGALVNTAFPPAWNEPQFANPHSAPTMMPLTSRAAPFSTMWIASNMATTNSGPSQVLGLPPSSSSAPAPLARLPQASFNPPLSPSVPIPLEGKQEDLTKKVHAIVAREFILAETKLTDKKNLAEIARQIENFYDFLHQKIEAPSSALSVSSSSSAPPPPQWDIIAKPFKVYQQQLDHQNTIPNLSSKGLEALFRMHLAELIRQAPNTYIQILSDLFGTLAGATVFDDEPLMAVNLKLAGFELLSLLNPLDIAFHRTKTSDKKSRERAMELAKKKSTSANAALNKTDEIVAQLYNNDFKNFASSVYRLLEVAAIHKYHNSTINHRDTLVALAQTLSKIADGLNVQLTLHMGSISCQSLIVQLYQHSIMLLLYTESVVDPKLYLKPLAALDTIRRGISSQNISCATRMKDYIEHYNLSEKAKTWQNQEDKAKLAAYLNMCKIILQPSNPSASMGLRPNAPNP